MTDTLKSICEQCTYLNSPQLDFIPSELTRHKEIILRDLTELVSAASAGFEKATTILAGSILEAILYTFLKGQENYIAGRRGTFTFNPEGAWRITLTSSTDGLAMSYRTLYFRILWWITVTWSTSTAS